MAAGELLGKLAVASLLLGAVACGTSSTSGTPSRDAGTSGAAGIGASGSAGAPSSAGSSGLGGDGAGGRAGRGGNAGSSGASTGGAATARDAGPSLDGAVMAHRECDADASVVQVGTQASIRSRVEGRNGAFEDRCDPNGDLIKYTCETEQTCIGFPNPTCTPFYTGFVRPSLVDCAGGCREGSCEDRCPAAGEHIVYEATDGTGWFTVRNEGDGETYECAVVFDNDLDKYDCIKDPRVGTEAEIDVGSNGTCEAEFSLAVVAKGTDAGGGSQCSLGCHRGRATLSAPAGTAMMTICPPPGEVAQMSGQGSPDIENQVDGTNGTFTDVCTSDGNLVDYSCQIIDKAHGPPYFVYSGAVVASFYDCGGACKAGACISRCPEMGQALSFETSVTNGTVFVRNQDEGRRYECVISWDDPGDGFDCAKGIRSGTTGHVNTSSASSGNRCISAISEFPVTIDGVTASCADCSPCKLTCRVTP